MMKFGRKFFLRASPVIAFLAGRTTLALPDQIAAQPDRFFQIAHFQIAHRSILPNDSPLFDNRTSARRTRPPLIHAMHA